MELLLWMGSHESSPGNWDRILFTPTTSFQVSQRNFHSGLFFKVAPSWGELELCLLNIAIETRWDMTTCMDFNSILIRTEFCLYHF